MLDIETSSNSDSLVSTGGVKNSDIEYLVDAELQKNIQSRRIRRELLRSKRKLDKKAIQDALRNLGKYKSSLLSDEDKGKREGSIGTKFKNSLEQLKEKFQRTFKLERSDYEN